MLETIFRVLRWFLVFALAIAVFAFFVHLILPLILTVIVLGGIYYFYKRNRLAKQHARYTPEGRKKVN